MTIFPTAGGEAGLTITSFSGTGPGGDHGPQAKARLDEMISQLLLLPTLFFFSTHR